MKINEVIKKENAIFIVPLFFFLFLILAGFYSFPAGDDYCYSYHTNNEPDLFSRIFNEYKTGNGRYISNLLVFNNPIAYDKMWLYHLTPFFLLLFGLFCLYRLCRKFIITSPVNIFLIALSLLTVIVLQQPEISESIYWYTGAVTYFPAGCMAWLIFSLLPDYRGIKKSLLSGFLIVIMTGFNETIMQITIVFAVLFFIKSALEKKLSSFQLIITSIAFAAALVMILSPGNSAREELFTGNHQLMKAITWPALQSVRFAGWFLLHPSVILVSIAVILFPLENHIHESVKKIKPVFYFLLISSVLYLAAFAPYYFTGVLGQHRTYNLAGMLFYPLYFAFLFSCGNSGYFNKIRSKINSVQLKRNLLRMAVLLIPFCYYGYFLFAETFSGKLKSHYKNHLKRETALKEAVRNKDDLFIFPQMENPSVILGSTDTDGSKDHWIFFCAEEFYKSRDRK